MTRGHKAIAGASKRRLAPVRIASATKPFTTLLAYQLVDAGKLRLDDRLSDRVPEYPAEKGGNITVWRKSCLRWGPHQAIGQAAAHHSRLPAFHLPVRGHGLDLAIRLGEWLAQPPQRFVRADSLFGRTSFDHPVLAFNDPPTGEMSDARSGTGVSAHKVFLVKLSCRIGFKGTFNTLEWGIAP